MTLDSSRKQRVDFRVNVLVCLLAALAIFGPGSLKALDVVDSPNDDGVTTVWQPDTEWFEFADEDWVPVPIRASGWTSMMPSISEAGECSETRPFILEKIGLSFLLTSNHLFRP